jgi:HD-GYP domain-containing protein (c-di-GMP phosphodiesterase class II)
MLKKISVDDLRTGMYLHGLCGKWVDHPFWKTKFVLDDPRDLTKLRESSIEACWIDVSKGADVAAASAPAPAASPVVVEPVPAAASSPALAPGPVADSSAPTSMADELKRASALVNASREQVMSMFQEARMGRTVEAEECLPMVADIAASVWRNPGAVISLARLKTHDDYSYMHSVAVCALMVSLARQLGQDEAQSREFGLAGLLHDMGKASIPLDILNKPGKLTTAEFDIIKTHPQRGHEMLLGGTATPAVALDVCLHHHERPDGKGYPFGLSGDALTLAARMGAVCDVYDAISSHRPYKAGWDPADSISRMSAWARDGQFDTMVFAAFVKSLGVYPIGSLVRMRSDRLAVVVEQSSGQLLKPWVKVFYSTRSQMPVTIELLDTGDARCSDGIAARESNETWKFPHLEALWAGKDALAALASGRAAVAA